MSNEGGHAIAIGDFSLASGFCAMAIGKGAKALGDFAIAIGPGANAQGDYAIDIKCDNIDAFREELRCLRRMVIAYTKNTDAVNALLGLLRMAEVMVLTAPVAPRAWQCKTCGNRPEGCKECNGDDKVKLNLNFTMPEQTPEELAALEKDYKENPEDYHLSYEEKSVKCGTFDPVCIEEMRKRDEWERTTILGRLSRARRKLRMKWRKLRRRLGVTK